MEFFVCFDEFYKMAKKHDGVKKIVVHFFLKSVIRVSKLPVNQVHCAISIKLW